MKRFTRQEILQRLHEKMERKEAIILSEAGIGIVAKIADMAKLDLITIATPGIYRMHGVDDMAAYRPYDDANGLILDLAKRIHSVVSDTPVIAGVFAADPYRMMDDVLAELFHYGVSGVTNVPSMGMIVGARRVNIEKAGIGFGSECEFIRECRKRDIFTIGHAFERSDLTRIAEAGADIACMDFRFLLEEITEPELFSDRDALCNIVQGMCEAARAVRPDVILVVHGGPFEVFENVEYCLAHTDANGYLGSASLDSIPITESVGKTLLDFAAHSLR